MLDKCIRVLSLFIDVAGSVGGVMFLITCIFPSGYYKEMGIGVILISIVFCIWISIFMERE